MSPRSTVFPPPPPRHRAAPLSGQPLPAWLVRTVLLALSASTGCEPCLRYHAAAARRLGMTAQERAAASRARAFDARTQLAIDYVLALHASATQRARALLRPLLRSGFDRPQLHALRALARLPHHCQPRPR